MVTAGDPLVIVFALLFGLGLCKAWRDWRRR